MTEKHTGSVVGLILLALSFVLAVVLSAPEMQRPRAQCFHAVRRAQIGAITDSIRAACQAALRGRTVVNQRIAP